VTFSRALFVATFLIECSVAIPSATAGKVKIDFDRDADFSHVQRYEWRTHPVFERNPQLKEVYSVGIQLVLSAGNRELIKRGLHPVESEPDVFVTFFLAAQDAERLKTTIESSPWWVSGYGWYGTPTWTYTEVEPYRQGTLVIDVVDARTSKLLWRAYCSDEIDDMRQRHKNINSIVGKSLGKFPPKKK
jgi:Domain of unknown function (DUF4136)